MPHSTEDGLTNGQSTLQQADENMDAENREDEDFSSIMNQLISGAGDSDILGPSGEQQEKAADAFDFEDIGDDDLADDEEDVRASPVYQQAAQPNGTEGLNGVDKYEDDDMDDLFGGGDEDAAGPDMDDLFGDGSSPPPTAKEGGSGSTTIPNDSGSFESATIVDSSFDPTQSQAAHSAPEEAASPIMDEDDLEDDPQWQLQQRLLKGGGETIAVDEDVFAALFPGYQPDRPPRWHELLGPRKAYYLGKTPLKPPKPVQPTKLSLNIVADQEKKFKLPATSVASYEAQLGTAEERGLTLTMDPPTGDTLEAEDESLEALADDEDDIGDHKWADIVAVCQDWDIATADAVDHASEIADSDAGFGILGEDDAMDVDPQEVPKKRKFECISKNPPMIDELLNAYIDDPEAATVHLAKRVRLDLNDPYLLLDTTTAPEKVQLKRKFGSVFKRDATGGLTREFKRRYDISNDAAYENLKKNHHGKVRAHLGGHDIEHSLPAARLQYPYYKVKLSSREARSFHRPALNFPYSANNYVLKPSRKQKRKDLKGKSASEIFVKCQDLSLSDNSSALLLEYSEEYPFMLSGFGMGSKLINHYRRRDKDDTTRPKQELGETNILMPEDKSPFSVFGEVEPGETVPTITNQMYRAPVFKHEPNQTDFIAVCSRTGADGRAWYLRKVENLHVVAQEFPLQEVPGTHSRKVTDAAKKRLRMLAWRMYKKQNRGVKNEPLLRHLPNTDLAQNRSKMREIMNYDKDKGWVPKQGEIIPDDAAIRSWISPEEICVLDSMQVGDQQLRDTGYNKADSEDESEADGEAASGQTLDSQLAPWNVTKNFLNACQGKAMVAVVGEGDPSGRGEAFSFIRTSMKGGFKDPEESIDKKLESKRRKDASGHQYNVAEQARAYQDAIQRTWQAQKTSLATSTLPEDDEPEEMDHDGRSGAHMHARAPSAMGGPSRAEDDSASLFSKMSASSQTGRAMKIVRSYQHKHTGAMTTSSEIITDPKVWKEYQKRHLERKTQARGFESLRPSGRAELDRTGKKILEAELHRLKKNKNRTTARDKSKGILPTDTPGEEEDAESPSAGAGGGEGGGRKKKDAPTSRRCNSCGNPGHIRTNKKLCPLLNGTIKPNNAGGDSAFGSLNTSVGNASSPPATG